MEANAQPTMVLDKATPFEVYEARNAVAIARTEGAPTYAPEAFNKAQGQLDAAEGTQGSKKDVARTARQATQSAEDARLIAVKRQETERLASERKLAQDTLDQANSDAAQAKLAADQASAAAATALASADSSRQAAQSENTNLRAQLLAQLSAILETRATARGLIVNMSGMTFNTSKSTLLPLGREKLAKIAGLVLAHPGLKMQVEGYTDSTGGDALNQTLSEKRADAARNYLVDEGVKSENITSKGLGKADPIDSNATAAGRSKNRRVELVVSGAGITDAAGSAN
jgi:outer membrane protein OmpA-like peptidoglycan-associated protein